MFLLFLLHIIISLLIFSAGISIIVFFIRPYVRRYKPHDLDFFTILNNYTSPFNNKVMLFITWLGKHNFLIPANLVLIAWFVFVEKQTWFSIRIAAIALSSLALMLLLKQLFRRKRPLEPLLFKARGLSFPSGHAIMAMTFYGLLIYITRYTIETLWLKNLIIIFLAILIFMIGFSRVYLRVHYPSDVLVGFIVGLLWLLLSLKVIRELENKRPENNSGPLKSGFYCNEGSLNVSPCDISPV